MELNVASAASVPASCVPLKSRIMHAARQAHEHRFYPSPPFIQSRSHFNSDINLFSILKRGLKIFQKDDLLSDEKLGFPPFGEGGGLNQIRSKYGS